MKRLTIVLMALLVTFTLSGIAAAEPTLFGPTGLFVSPTADVATPESAWIGGNYLDYSAAGLDSTIWTYTLTGGITEAFELGVMGMYQEDSDDGFGLNAKYQLMPESMEAPAVAIGVNYMDINDSMFQVYLVATKYYQGDDVALDRAVGIHGGVSYTDADFIVDEFNYWGGIDFNLHEDVIGIAEYTSSFGHTDNEAFSFGIRYYVTEQWTAQAGMIDGDLTVGTSVIF